MTHPRDEIHRAIAGLEAWIESDLAFGLDAAPIDPNYVARPMPAPTPAPAANANTAFGITARAPSRAVKRPSSPSPAVARSAATSPAPRDPAPPPIASPAPAPARVAKKTIPPKDVVVPVPPLAEIMGSRERLDRLEQVADRVYGCASCRLCEGRTHAVPGEGNADADLMFIGEGPGADEDRSGRPFVGVSGELLTKIIKAMGFSRETVFIANIVKCQPPGNRAPQPDEIGACFPHLRAQLEIVKPKVICTLGSPATRTLLGVTSGITQLRGKVMSHGSAAVVPTFHPAYLLRTPEDKPLVWKDALTIADLVVERGGSIPFPEVLERNRRPKA